MLKIQRSNEKITIHFIIHFGTAVQRSAKSNVTTLTTVIWILCLLSAKENLLLSTQIIRVIEIREDLSLHRIVEERKKKEKEKEIARKNKERRKRETDKSREATRKCFTWRTWPCEAAIAVKLIYGRTCENSAGATGRIMTLRGSTGASALTCRVCEISSRSSSSRSSRDTSRSRASCRSVPTTCFEPYCEMHPWQKSTRRDFHG